MTTIDRRDVLVSCVALACIVLSIFLAYMADCAPSIRTGGQASSPQLVFDGIINQAGISVYKVIIDGKPCLVAMRGVDGAGITCNWKE